ncbi:MAG: RnfABCDGE type electron transport complex subunit D, partial [Nanoarchaeota archaeon]
MTQEKLILTPAPHVKGKFQIDKIMLYVFISLLPASLAGIYYFGVNALWVKLVSISSCLLTEHIIYKIRKLPSRITDFSAAVTGLLLALVIPPGVPLWIP